MPIAGFNASGIWPALPTVALLIVLSAYAWYHRNVHGAKQFAAATIFATLWVLASIGEYTATDLGAKVFWYKLQVAWQLPTAVGISCFIFEYAWPGRWLTRRNLTLLSIPSLLMVLLILTNDLHRLLWISLTAEGSIAPVRGPATWILALYTSVLGLLQIVALVSLLARSPAHRWPATIIIVVTVGNRAAYALRAVGHPLGQYLPSEVYLITVACLGYGAALFGFRLLNPIAQAQRTAVDQMSDGMVVLDTKGRVASINPAAQEILGVSVRRVLGQHLKSLLPGSTALAAALEEAGPELAGITVGAGPTDRQVLLRVSDLKDWRGTVSGRLLLLRDVTAERQAQAQIIEHQKALATLTERERLARELHDSLGQTIAAAHIHAGTAKRLLDRGQVGDTDVHLQQLIEMTLDAEVDIREFILGARQSLTGHQQFFVALEEGVARFARRSGLAAAVHVSGTAQESRLAPVIEVQLLRIVQEALSNARKHAHAATVTVECDTTDSMLEVLITDDGRGFDPVAVARAQGEGYGLQTMRERAESLGGTFEVISAIGRGTQVAVRVPTESCRA